MTSKVTFQLIDSEPLVLEDVENLTGPTGTFMYWQVVYQVDGAQVRQFLHERAVNLVNVEGEEQLIEAAQAGSNKASQEFAKTLGLE
jgi:hypothetical protein